MQMLNTTLVLDQKFMKMPDNFTPDNRSTGDTDNKNQQLDEKVNPNRVVITTNGEEGTYSKTGLYVAVGVIFLLGFIAGIMVCIAFR